MDQGTKRIAARTAFVIVPAVVATFAISFSLRLALGLEIDWLSWIECLMIPIVVGTPIAVYIFRQAERLQHTHGKLEQSFAELQKTHERLSFVTSHDQMTGLLNREGFLRKVEEQRERSEGHVLLIVDADHFKAVNDRYGHPKGDEALVKIARALQYAVRRKDIVGRIGGEEFAILLVSVTRNEAMQMADLVRRQVQCIPWQTGDDAETSTLTVSIGGAEVARRDVKFSEVMRQADRCLYEAKRQGRNRVSFDYVMTAVA
jgi:diguanylate cyclase (GGDEF)-like protein